MRASVLSDWLAQRLVRGGEQPIYRQLHRLLQQAILSRELPAGTRVPSSRLLAAELGIARNTVTQVLRTACTRRLCELGDRPRYVRGRQRA